jgi:hypothetical protein
MLRKMLEPKDEIEAEQINEELHNLQCSLSAIN